MKKLLVIALTTLLFNCTQPEALIHGYTESQRKQIYHEAELANDGAVKEAENKYYPYALEEELRKGKWNGRRDEFNILFGNATLIYSTKKTELKIKYISEVAAKFNLEYDYIDTLFVEGIEKKWPSIYNQ